MYVVNFLFGLGIFLYGMSELEKGIRRLGDARLKLLLSSSTNSRLSSVTVGIVTTAILQSSSMVSLLVMAFASAGLLPLVNAIGIVLGANLGTTATGWIVATLGFKLDLEAAAIPLIGSAAFVMVLVRERTRLHSGACLFLGLGLLLFGLALMKSSMESLPEQVDVASLTGHLAFVYLLVGIVIAFLVQSSSAVMMMALAALNSNIIGLSEAAALVIGADLGTTSTTILGSLRGSVIKRKLAFAHVTFNLVVDLAAFFLLLPFLPQLLSLLAISDPLYGLVAFHSTMNIIGILVFLPFLSLFTNWIERVFARSKLQDQDILERVPANITDAALVALLKKTRIMQVQAISNALRLFGLHPEKNAVIAEIAAGDEAEIEFESFTRGYERLKGDESLVTQFILEMQQQPLNQAQAKAVETYAQIVRLLIYSNKTLKDIAQDLTDLRQSSDASLQECYDHQRQYAKVTSEKLLELLQGKHKQDYLVEELDDLVLRNDEHYTSMNRMVYKASSRTRYEPMALSMQLNVNHEVHHAARNFIQSIRELASTAHWPQETAASPVINPA